jgi:RNA polymerase sigma-70 factor (ECF subfamily)
MEGRNVEENFFWVFRRYHSAVSRFFSRRGFSLEDSNDLTQDVFFAVYVGIAKLRDEAAFVGWLFSIAQNIALRHWERQRKHSRLQLVRSNETDDQDAEIERVAALGPDPLSEMLQIERVEMVGAALNRLPDRVQDCLRASLLEDLTYREIGERLGISENTVAVHVHRGMKAIRTRLAEITRDGR